ncbi:hypothetical protein GBF38_001950 [Nibea albiflora]|uniref:Uncharacterized protein n=1 Tax=Nibea albiflora TaxID=240163 RepID=A0ACB7EGB3_NIBAL|nr:hypothetical protein GBF38_001950 [Nibea albiflora]
MEAATGNSGVCSGESGRRPEREQRRPLRQRRLRWWCYGDLEQRALTEEDAHLIPWGWRGGVVVVVVVEGGKTEGGGGGGGSLRIINAVLGSADPDELGSSKSSSFFRVSVGMESERASELRG